MRPPASSHLPLNLPSSHRAFISTAVLLTICLSRAPLHHYESKCDEVVNRFCMIGTILVSRADCGWIGNAHFALFLLRVYCISECGVLLISSREDGSFKAERCRTYSKHLTADSRKLWYRLARTVGTELNDVSRNMACSWILKALFHVSLSP